MASLATSAPPADRGPAWEIATLFPDQGQWSEWDYLYLNRLTNRYVEFSDGYVEVLPMPTKSHQRTVSYLHRVLEQFAESKKLGEAVIAPYPVKLRSGRFREPDVVFALSEHADWMQEDFAGGADLVVEVLSEDRNRDLVEKRREYAEANISEYWIVDPREKRVIVLKLAGAVYAVHGDWGAGQKAESWLLKGFAIAVDDLLKQSEKRV
jgi:Uma2 family endonuclease